MEIINVNKLEDEFSTSIEMKLYFLKTHYNKTQVLGEKLDLNYVYEKCKAICCEIERLNELPF